ncbi:hypothetical protein, partial [Bacteroides caecimuris]|uniref:hypothetical protein n=1 Tax=Bacteroides caecimuris TaxID=1796613 RepID=UPI0026DF625B
NKNKETSSQPLPEKYRFSLSHILWESIPLYYGNLFPQYEGIFSQVVGNLFPQYMGKSELVYLPPGKREER